MMVGQNICLKIEVMEEIVGKTVNMKEYAKMKTLASLEEIFVGVPNVYRWRED